MIDPFCDGRTLARTRRLPICRKAFALAAHLERSVARVAVSPGGRLKPGPPLPGGWAH